MTNEKKKELMMKGYSIAQVMKTEKDEQDQIKDFAKGFGHNSTPAEDLLSSLFKK